MPNQQPMNVRDEQAREQEFNSARAFHAIVVLLITTMGFLLQAKYSNNNGSPFDAHYRIMLAFIVVIFLYAIARAAEIFTQTRYAIYHAICADISLFSGGFASILLLIALVPIFGWILLALWGITFVKVIHDSHTELFHQAWSNVLRILMRHNPVEEEQPPHISPV